MCDFPGNCPREKDIRQLLFSDAQILQHLLPVSTFLYIKINGRSQNGILPRRTAGQQQGKPALQLYNAGGLLKDFRFIFSDPEEFCSRPDRVCANLSGAFLNHLRSEAADNFRRFFRGSGVTPQDGPAERSVIFIQQEHGLPLGGKTDHFYVPGVGP